MAKNYANVRVFGDAGTEVFLAPVGSTLPTTLADPTTPFLGTGWLSEEGMSIDVSADVKKFTGIGGVTIRTKVTSTSKTVKFQLLEDTKTISGLYFGAGSPTVAGGVARLDLPEQIPTVQRAAVLKNVDGAITEFICIPVLEFTDRGTLAYKADDMKIFEFTGEIIGTSYMLTNSPAYTS